MRTSRKQTHARQSLFDQISWKCPLVRIGMRLTFASRGKNELTSSEHPCHDHVLNKIYGSESLRMPPDDT